MQKQTPPEATKAVYPILRQIVNLIPPNIFHAAASATKDLSRVFTPWSHVVALIYQQLTKTESLNGVCDAARLHASQWQELRGAVPPRRNTFSNANQHRDPTMMETLYWKMLDYLGGLSPEFVSIRNPSVLARFKKRHIHLLDSSTIQLVLNSIDWARHRARKAAAKPHPRPLEPITTIEDAGIILFRWFCLQQFFNFTHHRLHHTMPSTTMHVFYNIEPLPSQAEVLSFLWHFSDGCVRGADVEHLRSRGGRTRQARPSRRNQAAAPLPSRCYASAARCIVTGLRSCEPSGWTMTVQSKTSGQPGRFVTWTATSPVGWPCASRTASTRKAA